MRAPSTLLLVIVLALTLLVPSPIGEAAVTTPVMDSFNRDVDRGWGTAEQGGAWILDSSYGTRVDNGVGVMQVPSDRGRTAYLRDTIVGTYRAAATFGFPELLDTGSVRAGLALKRIGDSYYAVGVRVNSAGFAFLSIRAMSGPWLDSRLAIEEFIGRIDDGGRISVQAEAGDGEFGVIRAKAWIAGGAVPEGWLVSGQSSSVAPQGAVGVHFDVGGLAPDFFELTVDDLSVEQGSVDPANESPTPMIAVEQLYEILRVDGSASQDPDGSVTSYEWDYGDGTTATGPKPAAHTYASKGVFAVTLTVTDDKGATSSTTTKVEVHPYKLPDETNTGVPAGTPLTRLTTDTIPYPDDSFGGSGRNRLIIRTPGAIYDGFEFHNLVEVRAPGVVFRNSSFVGPRVIPRESALLQVVDVNLGDRDLPSALVEDSTFRPAFPSREIDGVRGSNFTLRRVEITDTVDGAHIYGPRTSRSDPAAGNVTIEASWIHDLIYYKDDDNHPDGTHNDAVQIRSGRHIHLLGNRFDGTFHNSVVQVTTARGDVGDVSIVGNYISGGACSLNVDDTKGPGPVTGLRISLNIFERGSTYYRDCADLVTPRTFAITTVKYDFWSDLSDPPPIRLNGDATEGWSIGPDGDISNAVWPTAEDWLEQFN